MPADDELNLGRRDFMLAGTGSLLTLSTPSRLSAVLGDTVGNYQFQGVADLFGPAAARPDPGSDFFDNKLFYAYRYTAADSGAVSEITQDDSEWRELPTHLPGYPTADLPADPPNGTLYFDQHRNLPAWWDTDHYEYPSFIDDVLTESVPVTNTTTRTEVFNPDINANSLVVGRDYELTISGKFSTANNSDTFDVIVDIGGVDVATLTNAGKNVTDAHFRSVCEFSVRPGSGEDVELAPESYGRFDEQPRGDIHDPVVVDPATATNLSVDILWSAASPDNSVTVERGTLQQRA